MKTYARIEDGQVVELFATEGDITSMFNPALTWVDVSANPEVTENWQFDGSVFRSPPPPPLSLPGPTIAELRTRIEALSAQLATLSDKR